MSKLLTAIRKAILQSGETRYAISMGTGIDQSQLTKLMKGRSGLSLESFEKLANYLDLEIVIRPRKRKTDGKHK